MTCEYVDPAATSDPPWTATGAIPGLYSEGGPHLDQYPRPRSEIIPKLAPLRGTNEAHYNPDNGDKNLLYKKGA